MAIDLKKFIATTKKIDKEHDRNCIDHEFFFRDPSRTHYIDKDYFYSPADGVILYQDVVKNPNDKILEVKGKYFTIREILEDKEYNKPSIVISVFMTQWDVHINRIPYSGVVNYKELNKISTDNIPMLATEKGLFKNIISDNAIDYITRNQRMLNRIFSPRLNMEYFVVQFADKDVCSITPFSTKQNTYYNQNCRFSAIRWGSQCDLIIPLSKKYGFELLQKERTHVEAGIDKLVKIIPKVETI